MVDLHTYVAGRSGTVKHSHLTVLGLQESLCLLLGTHTQVHRSQLGEGGQTCLELLLLTLQDVLKVLAERHAVEGAHEDTLGSILG